MPDENKPPVSAEEIRSYGERAYEFAKKQYADWAPWIEEQYLKRFSNDNKASYLAKGALSIPSYLRYIYIYATYNSWFSHISS